MNSGTNGRLSEGGGMVGNLKAGFQHSWQKVPNG